MRKSKGTIDLFEEQGAQFSADRKYRYALWRIWDNTKPAVMFIGLNPSTANETDPDATITRVIQMAKFWRYGGVYMLNCFAYVSTDPDQLRDIGNDIVNDQWLASIGLICPEVIFAWGNFKIVKETSRDKELTAMFPNAKALIINKDGSPRHPLYVPTATLPILYNTPKI